MEPTNIPVPKNRKRSKTPVRYPKRISTFVVAYAVQEIHDDPQKLEQIPNQLSIENCTPSLNSISPSDSAKTFTITPTENLTSLLDVASISEVKCDIIDENQCGDVETKTSRTNSYTVIDNKSDKKPEIIYNASKHIRVHKENKTPRKKPRKNKRLIKVKNINFKYGNRKSIIRRLEKHCDKSKMNSSNAEQIDKHLCSDILSKVNRTQVLKKAWAKVNLLENSEHISSSSVKSFEQDNDSLRPSVAGPKTSDICSTSQIEHDNDSLNSTQLITNESMKSFTSQNTLVQKYSLSSRNEDSNSLGNTHSIDEVTSENQTPYKTEVFNVALATAQNVIFSGSKTITDQISSGMLHERVTSEKSLIQNNLTSNPSFNKDVKNSNVDYDVSTDANINKNVLSNDDFENDKASDKEALLVTQTSTKQELTDVIAEKPDLNMFQNNKLYAKSSYSLKSNVKCKQNDVLVTKKLSLPLTPKNKENVTQVKNFSTSEIDINQFAGNIHKDSFNRKKSLTSEIKNNDFDNEELSQTTLKENNLSNNNLNIIESVVIRNREALIVARTSPHSNKPSEDSDCTLTIKSNATMLLENVQDSLPIKDEVTDNTEKTTLLNMFKNDEFYPRSTYSLNSNGMFDNELDDVLIAKNLPLQLPKSIINKNITQGGVYRTSKIITDEITGDICDSFGSDKTLVQSDNTSKPPSSDDMENINIGNEIMSHTILKGKDLSHNEPANKSLVIPQTSSHSNKSDIDSDCTLTINLDNVILPETVQDSIPNKDELTDNNAQKTPLLNKVKCNRKKSNSNANCDNELNDVLVTKNLSLPLKPKSKIDEGVHRNVSESRKYIKMRSMKMLKNSICPISDKGMRVKIREIKRNEDKDKYPTDEIWDRLTVMLDMAVRRMEKTLGDRIEKDIRGALKIFNQHKIKCQTSPIEIQLVQTSIASPVNRCERPIPVMSHKEVLVVKDHIKQDIDTHIQCDLVQGQLIDELLLKLSTKAQKPILDTEELLKMYEPAEVVKDRLEILKPPVALAKDSVVVEIEKEDMVTDSTLTAVTLISSKSSFNQLKHLCIGFMAFLRENVIVLTGVPTFFIVMFCVYGIIVIIMQAW